MSRFSQYYKNHIAKSGGSERVAAIDFMVKDIVDEMQSKVDPTRWNVLLEQKDALEAERAEIVSDQGEVRVQ